MLVEKGIRLYVLEKDIYARQAIVSYLSWDRRTRVVGHAGSINEMLDDIVENHHIHLSAVIIDELLLSDGNTLTAGIQCIQTMLPGIQIICLAHQLDRETALAARQAGATAYLVRETVGIAIASAVAYALEQNFVVTPGLQTFLSTQLRSDADIAVLPNRRRYPRLTQRIEQALWLCVVEGLPAELAAEEMGVSTSTVRSYIKEGYRILEANDDTIYPLDISPVERAFLRFSALEQRPPASAA